MAHDESHHLYLNINIYSEVDLGNIQLMLDFFLEMRPDTPLWWLLTSLGLDRWSQFIPFLLGNDPHPSDFRSNTPLQYDFNFQIQIERVSQSGLVEGGMLLAPEAAESSTHAQLADVMDSLGQFKTFPNKGNVTRTATTDLIGSSLNSDPVSDCLVSFRSETIPVHLKQKVDCLLLDILMYYCPYGFLAIWSHPQNQSKVDCLALSYTVWPYGWGWGKPQLEKNFKWSHMKTAQKQSIRSEEAQWWLKQLKHGLIRWNVTWPMSFSRWTNVHHSFEA